MDRPIAEIEQRFADLLPLTGQDLAAVLDELNRLRTENAELKAAAAPYYENLPFSDTDVDRVDVKY